MNKNPELFSNVSIQTKKQAYFQNSLVNGWLVALATPDWIAARAEEAMPIFRMRGVTYYEASMPPSAIWNHANLPHQTKEFL